MRPGRALRQKWAADAAEERDPKPYLVDRLAARRAGQDALDEMLGLFSEVTPQNAREAIDYVQRRRRELYAEHQQQLDGLSLARLRELAKDVR